MKHKQKEIIIGILIAVVAFAGGYMLGGRTNASTPNGARMMQFASGRGGMRMNGAGAMGTVTNVNATSLTLTMRDGSSRVVLLSPNTQVMKSVAGSANDLSDGETVTVFGTQNSDGSLTAQSVQVRPAAPAAGTQVQPQQ